ncbi:hypothetical protein [Demequina sp.]|uniref:hypothetical protein n=1 Tax=Demequina sp. TaxID=2050685 RepID=UPI0025B8B44A|nr:hypothetical protein [Demequina sp.]
MTTRSRFPIAVVTIATLTACSNGGATPSPTQTTTTSPEPTETVTASPSPEPEPRPSLAELTVSPNGLLPMRIGEAPDEGTSAQMLEFDEEYCADLAMGDEPESSGRWVSTYDRVEGHFGGETEAFTVSVSNEIVTRIDVFGLGLETTDGVGIGTPIDELRATYPNLAEGSSGGDFSTVWWLIGEEGNLVFETQEEGGNGTGGQEVVILMRIIEASYDPDFSAAGTDDIAGGCL